MAILLDGEQRFTCQHCGRCCRHGWDIPILPDEVAAYRSAGAQRWFREHEDGPEGAASEPFEPVRGAGGLLRLRKRADGTCGFLSPAGLCRIHEELGERRKPLACRAFPFRVHPTQPDTIVAASFSCPTVVRNEGAPADAQRTSIERLARDWQRAFPEAPCVPCLVPGRPIDAPTLALLRQTFLHVLARPDGDLCTNLGHLADLLDDLTRPRVARMPPEAFMDYVSVMGRHAAESQQPRASRPPARLAGLFFRGYLFASTAIQMRLDAQRRRGGRVSLWARQLWLLAHAHGLAPAPSRLDLVKALQHRLPDRDRAVWELARSYFRASLAGIGTGRWPVVAEIGVAAATLRTAFVYGALHAGEGEITGEGFVRGLTEAADIHHAGSGVVARLLGLLGGGTGSLHALAAWGAAPRESPS